MSEVAPHPSDGLPREELFRLLRAASLPFAACLVFFLITPSALRPLQKSRPEVRREVIRVVEAQFKAFREGDYARAWSLAAPGIQEQFTVTAFERMVREGFPIIAHWRAVSFFESQDNGREAVLVVSVQGRSGRTRYFRYLLVREAQTWRINGVVEVNVSPPTHGQLA